VTFAERVKRPGGLADMQFSRREAAITAERVLTDKPDAFIVDSSPQAPFPWNDSLLEHLGNVHGSRILHLGCALGEFSVFLAKRGASVRAVEASTEALAMAGRIAELNRVRCEFANFDPRNFGVPPESVDLVLGIGTLHHLSKPDVQSTLLSSHHVLRPGARAIFVEGIENSRLFSFFQNLVPVGQPGTQGHRPSILTRRAWRSYLDRLEERDISIAEFRAAVPPFKTLRVTGFGLLDRFDRLVGEGAAAWLRWMDQRILTGSRTLQRYARTALVEVVK
jgi:SAM-dependent methyltransferase